MSGGERIKKKGVSFYFNSLNIRTKMLLMLLPIIVVFFLCIYFIYHVMITDLQSYVIENNFRLLSLINNDITAELGKVEDMAYSFLSNQYIRNYISLDSTARDKVDMQSQLTRTFKLDMTKSVSSSNMTGVMIIINENEYVYGHISSVISPQERSTLASYIYRRYDEGYDSAYIAPPEELMDKIGYLCFVLPISDNTALVRRAYLVMNISRFFLANIAAKYYTDGMALIITNSTGQLIWKSSLLPESKLADVTRGFTETGNYFEKTQSGETLVMNYHMDKFQLNATIQIPMENITSKLSAYQIIFWSAVCLVSAFALLLLFYASRAISVRLREMGGVIRDIKNGDINSRFPIKYQDEISVIGAEFNKMIDQVQYLNLNVAEQKLRQREAEMRALQSQINPHFLYNTLESLRMMAHINNDDDVAQKIKLLSNLFRYTTSFSALDDEVTIRQELEHTRTYLELQRFRFLNRFSVDIGVPEDMLDSKILKIVLQPIVENAFKHGMRAKKNGGRIIITGFVDVEHDRNVLSVLDNGQGIPENKLRELNEAFTKMPEKAHGGDSIGLANVNGRLKLFYGEQYGIKIDSIVGEGTEIQTYLPIHKRE